MPTQDATIETLNKLIETCKDGEYGLLTSAEVLQSDEYKAPLRQRAAEFHNAATALQYHVHQLGGPAEGGGHGDRRHPAARSLVEQQLDDVKHSQARFRKLRDRARAAQD